MLLSLTTFGQNIFGGFKAGLNVTSIVYENKEGDGTTSYEPTGNNTGFHVGGLVGLKLSESFGVKLELLYSQKGGRYRFDGPGYQIILHPQNDKYYILQGDRRTSINIVNAHVDFPLLVYTDVLKNRLRIEGGGYLGILVGSLGRGETIFTSDDLIEPDELIVTQTHSYYRDEAGQNLGTSLFNVVINDQGSQRNIENAINQTQGAYALFTEKDGNFYHTLDYGLVGGLSYRMGGSLRLGARVNYGLRDVTNNFYDVSLVSLESYSEEGFTFNQRADKDFNLGYQFFLAFNF